MADTARRRGVERAIAVTTSPESLLALAVLVGHVVVTLAYLAVTDTQLFLVRSALYPIAWISLSAYFVGYVWRRGPRVRASRSAVAVGVGYGLVLAVAGGLVTPLPGPLGYHFQPSSFRLRWLVPGWGPVALFGHDLLKLSVIPFKLIGYTALAYGVAAAVAGRSRGALAGVFGVFSCVGCLVPLAALAGGVFTSGASALAAVGGNYDIGTAVFAVTVLLLLVAVPTKK